MGFLADQDTGAMCAVLLSIAAFPALVYAGYARFTGRGRKGGAPWRPLEDPINLICAAVAVAGHALASVVVGGWGELFGFMTPAFIGGCNSSALAYAWGGDGGGRAVRPALLLVVPYAFALGFFGRIAG